MRIRSKCDHCGRVNHHDLFEIVKGHVIEDHLKRMHLNDHQKADVIVRKTCMYYDVPYEQLRQNLKCRKAIFVRIRQVSFYLINDMTKLSLAQIGLYFMKDHSTVIHSVKQIRNDMTYDLKLKQQVDDIRDSLLIINMGS